MSAKFSSHPKARYWSAKNDCDPDDVALNSHNFYWFDCDKCEHDFERKLNTLVSFGTWCPYCSNQKLCKDQDCADCFEKSFASHEYVRYWCGEKNTVDPRDVFLGSKKEYWFKCPDCPHTFKKQLKRIKATGGWCQYCKSLMFCDDECDWCYNNSLASDPRAQYFVSSESGKDPRHIAKKGSEICTFKCQECFHLFSAKIGNIISLDSWCGFCTSRKWCDDKDCEQCFNMSFASNEKAQYIVDKTIDTSRIRKYSNEKHDFCCERCHNIFSKRISDITRGSWCPKCHNKGELKLHDTLIEDYPKLEFQKCYEWCKGDKGKCYPYDFILPDEKINIELDGEQHFYNVNDKWKGPDEQRERDVYKMKCANEQGYSVIRLLQTDVFYNKNNWKKLLEEAIANAKKAGKKILNQYIGKNGIYKCHISDMKQENARIKNISIE